MILPSKVLPIEKTLLYKSLLYYKEVKDLEPSKHEEVLYLVVLYSIGYIDYAEEKENDLRVYKIK